MPPRARAQAARRRRRAQAPGPAEPRPAAGPRGAGQGGRHRGLQYLRFLERFADLSAPTSYLEIGTRDGSSLAAFGCDAICVDPSMRPKPGALDRARSFCFQMTSDRFFDQVDVLTIFPGGVDVAFLDGMHRFEYLLRDLTNTERCCHERSTIFVHDCFPAREALTGRVSRGAAWAGDVWKLVPILNELRGDLTLTQLDCPPTGLLMIQGVDPASEVLRLAYHEAVGRYARTSLGEYGIERLWSDVDAVATRELAEDEARWSLTMASYGTAG
jgi:hypothetical protein